MVGPNYETRDRAKNIGEAGECGFRGEVGGLIIARDRVGQYRLFGPLVSAATALLKANNPFASPDDIEQTLGDAADNLDPMNPQYAGLLGAGRLNIPAAVPTNDYSPDLNQDSSVNAADLIILLSNWGPWSGCTDCPADLNDDCVVGGTELIILLGNWGKVPRR